MDTIKCFVWAKRNNDAIKFRSLPVQRIELIRRDMGSLDCE